jgi:hypothetical protein
LEFSRCHDRFCAFLADNVIYLPRQFLFGIDYRSLFRVLFNQRDYQLAGRCADAADCFRFGARSGAGEISLLFEIFSAGQQMYS